MTEPASPRRFVNAWLAYVQACESVKRRKLTQPDRRYMRHLEALEGAVERELRTPTFLDNLDRSWQALDTRSHATASLLLQEVSLYPEVVSAATEGPAGPRQRSREQTTLKDLLGAAKTILDSIKDLLDDLPISVKGPMTVFGEILEILKG